MKILPLKRTIQFLIICSLSSCGIFNSYNKAVIENNFARKELKKKTFKAKFSPEMTSKIDTGNCYYCYYEIPQRNYKGFFYLRLFKNGQYAYFASNKNDIDINKLDRASYVGYYIVEDNILKLETPTGNINTKSYRIIWDFEIENNGTLKNKKSNLEYEIIKDISLMKIEPDW